MSQELLQPWYPGANFTVPFLGSISSEPTTLQNYLEDVAVSLAMAVFAFSSLANVINITVFLKLGFKSTSNVSFFALAVADLLVGIMFTACLVNMHSVLQKPWTAAKKFVSLHFLPTVEALSAFGSWVTTIITWERLCCVAFPFTGDSNSSSSSSSSCCSGSKSSWVVMVAVAAATIVVVVVVVVVV
ncbi:LOW QUALITY PROTEIN: hypothetical protein ElyMa_001251500, partial [Elysia marginata]